MTAAVPTTMRRLRYFGEGRTGIEDVPLPAVGPGEALIRIEASALCGSERQDILIGRDGNFGHEASGVIVQVEDGNGFQIGERVGLFAVLGCGECASCQLGRETMCERVPSILSGWHADYASVPIRALRAVPQDYDPGLVALMTGDALGVPARSSRRVPSEEGQTVLIVGLGPVGLAHVLLRAHQGARVIGVEPSPYRRELAMQLGASEVYEPGAYKERAGIVIECTGVPAVIEKVFDLVETSGTVLQSGECEAPVPINPSATFIHREVTYTGSWYYATEDYEHMKKLVADGLPLSSLSTHDVEASASADAIDQFMDGRTGKVIFRWS